MKPDIHPKYYPNARVICACGNTWTTGATQPEIRVDVCSNCHPFYTGEQRIVDTAGRVDRFRMRLAQKREQKVKEPRKEKFVVVNPDEPVNSPAPEPAVAVAAAEKVVAAPAPKAAAAEAPAAETEPEVLVRTVVEDSAAGERVVDDDDDGGARRAKTRKPRARKRKPEATTGDGGTAPAAADSGDKA